MQDPNNRFITINQVIETREKLAKAVQVSNIDSKFEDMCFEWSIFDVIIDSSK